MIFTADYTYNSAIIFGLHFSIIKLLSIHFGEIRPAIFTIAEGKDSSIDSKRVESKPRTLEAVFLGEFSNSPWQKRIMLSSASNPFNDAKSFEKHQH